MDDNRHGTRDPVWMLVLPEVASHRYPGTPTVDGPTEPRDEGSGPLRAPVCHRPVARP
jgi:hypothetical protein